MWGGGGYAINAALTEKRIKAVVSITGVNIGRLFREGFSNYDPIGALNAMASQRTKEARGGELQINELLPASLDAAKAHGLTERDVYEATDYYKTYSAAIFLIPICISFDTAEKRRYATYLILNRRFSFEF